MCDNFSQIPRFTSMQSSSRDAVWGREVNEAEVESNERGEGATERRTAPGGSRGGRQATKGGFFASHETEISSDEGVSVPYPS